MFRIDRPIARISSFLVLYRVPRSGSFTLEKRSKSHGIISGEYGGCSRIFHCQRCKRFLTAVSVKILAFSWRIMGFCTTKCRSFFLSLDEGCAAGTCSCRQRLPSALEVQRCAILPHQWHSPQWTAQCVGRSFFRGEQGCFHSFDWRFTFSSYEQAQVSSMVTISPRKSSSPSLWYRSNKACATA